MIQKPVNIITMFFILFLVSFQLSCKSSEKSIHLTGWIDETTYRITAEGLPESSLTNEEKKKQNARKMAVRNAHMQIWDKFTGNIIDSGYGICSDSEKSTGLEVFNIIRNGKIISEKFDNNFKCEIIFEVKHDELKKKVDSLTVCNVRFL